MSASLGLRLRQHCQLLTSAIFILKKILDKELEHRRLQQISNHKLSKNVDLENIHWVVHQIVMSQTDVTV